jgi:hypothetical protein
VCVPVVVVVVCRSQSRYQPACLPAALMQACKSCVWAGCAAVVCVRCCRAVCLGACVSVAGGTVGTLKQPCRALGSSVFTQCSHQALSVSSSRRRRVVVASLLCCGVIAAAVVVEPSRVIGLFFLFGDSFCRFLLLSISFRFLFIINTPFSGAAGACWRHPCTTRFLSPLSYIINIMVYVILLSGYGYIMLVQHVIWYSVGFWLLVGTAWCVAWRGGSLLWMDGWMDGCRNQANGWWVGRSGAMPFSSMISPRFSMPQNRKSKAKFQILPRNR